MATEIQILELKQDERAQLAEFSRLVYNWATEMVINIYGGPTQNHSCWKLRCTYVNYVTVISSNKNVNKYIILVIRQLQNLVSVFFDRIYSSVLTGVIGHGFWGVGWNWKGVSEERMPISNIYDTYCRCFITIHSSNIYI